ncbi:MAG: hypothetical protein IPN83_00015 [Holophagales bacterium]|nr:hypothetical protein [Holophagales bacterium]
MAAGLGLARRSDPVYSGPADVFLLDTIGELASAYRLGDVALLGGTLERGCPSSLAGLPSSSTGLHSPHR